jgi:hypothetical protein
MIPRIEILAELKDEGVFRRRIHQEEGTNFGF